MADQPKDADESFLRLREAVNVDDLKERDKLVRRYRRARALAAQNVADAEHWNRTHPNEPPLDMTTEREIIAWVDGVGPMPAEVRERIARRSGC